MTPTTVRGTPLEDVTMEAIRAWATEQEIDLNIHSCNLGLPCEATHPVANQARAFHKSQVIAAYLNGDWVPTEDKRGFAIIYHHHGSFRHGFDVEDQWRMPSKGMPVFATRELALKAIALMGTDALNALFGVNT